MSAERAELYTFLYSHAIEEQLILMNMPSPNLLKAWLSNPVTGLQFTSFFCGYRKLEEKRTRIMNAIYYTAECDVLSKAVHHTRHIVTTRKETFMKKPPAVIRANLNLLAALKYVDLDIDQYEHSFVSSPLPKNVELTNSTIVMILSADDFIEVAHLSIDARIEK